jgi:hypothetical protein
MGILGISELIIWSVITLYIIYWVVQQPVHGDEKILVSIFIMFMSVLMYVLVVTLFINALIIGNIVGVNKVDIVKTSIVSLSNNQQINGRFFVLGSGYINQKSYYIYMAETVDGGFIRQQIPTDTTVVYEVDSEDAYLQWNEHSKQFPNWFRGCAPLLTYSTNYKLFVPKGTIIRSISIN